MQTALRVFFGLVVLIGSKVLAADGGIAVTAAGEITVDVIVELTDAGKKVERPTLGRPAYYLPISAGYNPGGQPTFWLREPPAEPKIIKELAKALAGQGYLVATREHHPSLLLVVSWGYVAPHPAGISAYLMYIGRRPPMPTIIPMHAIANAAEMLALTAGFRSLGTRVETDRGAAGNEAVAAAGVPRYYTKVVAVDYSDWLRRRYTPLWTACFSVPYWGCYLDEALPVLLKTGAPMFGRDMSAPQMVKASILREGRVELGAPVVKEYLTPNPPSPAAP